MNCLILFSGTKSFEKVLEEDGNTCYSVDIDNHFLPTFNVDILKWNYKKDLRYIHIDYLHSSPICKHFTPMKNGRDEMRDMELGTSLVDKTLEILHWLMFRNPKLKFTIENPKGKMRELPQMKHIRRITTSYCMYGFPYQKLTDFWYGGFDLRLECCSRRKEKLGFPDACKSMRENKGIHPVRIGFVGSMMKDGTKKIYENQVIGWRYFKELKRENPVLYKGYSETHFRYRIPELLIESIYEQIKPEPVVDEIRLYQDYQDMVIIDDDDRLDFIDYP